MSRDTQLVPLDSLARLITDKTFGSKDPSQPYVGLEHMHTCSPDLMGHANAADSVSVNGVFEKDDILFGKLRPNLRKSVLAPFRGYCSTDILVLRANAGFHPGFVARTFQSEGVFARAVQTSIGTKMPRTSWAALRQLPVYAPSLLEQEALSGVIDQIDEQIRSTEQLVAKLKLVKQGLLHDLLTRGIDNNGELRDPDRHPEQFKDSPLGRIPRDWDVAPLAQYGHPRRSYLKTGPFGSSLKQEHWTKQGVPVVTIGSLGDGGFITSELLYVSPLTARALAAYALQPGDVVFSRVADVGRSAVVTSHESGWIMSSNMMWICTDPARARAGFVQSNISGNHRVREQISRFVNAAGRDVANANIMNLLNLTWPSIQEQDAILKVLAGLNAKTAQTITELAKLRLVKQALMNDLLSGRVRLTPLLEGSTSTL